VPWIVRYTVNYRGSRNRRVFYIRPENAQNTLRDAERFPTKDDAGRKARYLVNTEFRQKGHTNVLWEFIETKE
jgi:hypothetical protein